MSEVRDIFKIAIFSPHLDSYEFLKNEESIFGYEFHKSYVQTQGAAFAFSHFNLAKVRLTAQLWCLDPEPQWFSVRNLYLKKTSGIILLLDKSYKYWEDIINRLLTEFVTVNRFSVPILILSLDQDKVTKSITKYKNFVERWAGVPIDILSIHNKKEAHSTLTEFMFKVMTWRAKSVTFQTMKLYFTMDMVIRENRSISAIIKHLRKIYISRYIMLVDDNFLEAVIADSAMKEGFQVQDGNVHYRRELGEEPTEFRLQSEVDISRPKIKRN